MSRNELAGGATSAPDDFESIEKAVMESQRGRWFLSEYARRQRGSETTTLLNAIGKLENAVAANQDLIAERLTKALGLITSVDSKLSQMPGKAPAPVAGLSPQHLKFFKQDEELFEASAKPVAVAVAAVRAPDPKPEVAKGAKLVIHRRTETPAEAALVEAVPALAGPVYAELSPPPASAPEQPPAAEIQPKRRIVIIRHKADEEIYVPLQEELRTTA